MADASASEVAGPSKVDFHDDVRLAEAKFHQGIQAIKANDLDQAVELFGQVLQTRCQQFGDVDVRCASTYFRYGAALFYKAQDEQDVFGSSLQAATAHEDAEAAEEESSEDEKENVDDKGKKPMREEDLPQAQAAEDDAEADDSPGSRTDMELAWENLEVAKFIYERETQGSYAKELADIHSLLADIGMEQENFESALQDHKRALQLLSSILQADDRRLAELHYKLSLTLQYLDQPEDSLMEIKTAVKLIETRIDNINSAPPQKGSPQPSSADETAAGPCAPAAAQEAAAAAAGTSAPVDSTAEAESAKQELADLQGVLEDMYEKVEELQQVLKDHLSTKNALKAAFSQVAGSLGPAQVDPSSSRTGAGAGAGPSIASAPAAAVVDLGVVGRGTKRVTPVPLAFNTGPGTLPGVKTGSQKRSLEDLMSGGAVNSAGTHTVFGGSSTTSIGFGAAALQPCKSPWPTAPAASKKQKTELMEQSANSMAAEQAGAKLPVEQVKLPVFLQAASVAATYGAHTTSSKE